MDKVAVGSPGSFLINSWDQKIVANDVTSEDYSATYTASSNSGFFEIVASRFQPTQDAATLSNPRFDPDSPMNVFVFDPNPVTIDGTTQAGQWFAVQKHILSGASALMATAAAAGVFALAF